MKQQNFEKLLKKDKYQVFLFVSAAHFPFIFASHPWFVLNQKGKLSRWEVLHYKNEDPVQPLHIHKDSNPHLRGIKIFSFHQKLHWNSKLVGYIEGDDKSTAEKIIKFVENSKETYPHNKIYSLSGVNSNTFARWILNNFPDWKINLPWNSFGKKI